MEEKEENVPDRNCYCGSLDREYLEKEGVPEGYCGICDVCGEPGHMQHFPGPVPYTGAWCDECLKGVRRGYIIRAIMNSLIMLAVAGAIIYGVVKLIKLLASWI